MSQTEEVRLVDGQPNTDEIVDIWTEMKGKCIQCWWRIDVSVVTYRRAVDWTRYEQRERSGCNCSGRHVTAR